MFTHTIFFGQTYVLRKAPYILAIDVHTFPLFLLARPCLLPSQDARRHTVSVASPIACPFLDVKMSPTVAVRVPLTVSVVTASSESFALRIPSLIVLLHLYVNSPYSLINAFMCFLSSVLIAYCVTLVRACLVSPSRTASSHVSFRLPRSRSWPRLFAIAPDWALRQLCNRPSFLLSKVSGERPILPLRSHIMDPKTNISL
ncbi:hypothetical protein EDB84DRAFT_1549979 [Lactarius hengduanensis]|nr:hypothetical protein EDB84DRAFT_1549979 [Lactarius hengduanensis]